jgi:hypothetical protein
VSEESADVGSALASLASAGHEDPTSLTAEGGDEGAQFSLTNVNNSCRITLTDSGSLTIESAGWHLYLPFWVYFNSSIIGLFQLSHIGLFQFFHIWSILIRPLSLSFNYPILVYFNSFIIGLSKFSMIVRDSN